MVDAARLRRTKDILEARSKGIARSDPHFAVRARPNGAGHVRLAISSSRDLGNAVRRNRARRRLREAVRLDLAARADAPALDLVLSARRRAYDAPVGELRQAVHRVLDGLLGA